MYSVFRPSVDDEPQRNCVSIPSNSSVISGPFEVMVYLRQQRRLVGSRDPHRTLYIRHFFFVCLAREKLHLIVNLGRENR